LWHYTGSCPDLMPAPHQSPVLLQSICKCNVIYQHDKRALHSLFTYHHHHISNL
jgi:hypothetical protein